jgi:hypothetical protein
MSQLSAFMGQCFATASKIIGEVTMTKGSVSRPCQLDSAQATKTLMESGLWSKATHTAELTRARFTELTIVDRAVVSIGGTSYRVILIDGLEDLADPCVRVHLRLAHLPA